MPGGDGGSGGFGAAPGAADDEPQAASEVPIPIAAIVRNIAEPPTALPMAVKNSRRRMSRRSDVMPSLVLLALAVSRESLAKQYLIIIFRLCPAAFAGYGIRHRPAVRIPE